MIITLSIIGCVILAIWGTTAWVAKHVGDAINQIDRDPDGFGNPFANGPSIMHPVDRSRRARRRRAIAAVLWALVIGLLVVGVPLWLGPERLWHIIETQK